ncbi:TIGR02285 family protein [Pseudomonas sp. NA-150]|uniref:TIGR02285 family protein n=1 Tax=Pseudomonas sp. NA-150 TaxID=3367525 RepID=UPI0037C71FE4
MVYRALPSGKLSLKLALLLLALVSVPRVGLAKDTLIWLLRDLPPLTIADGPQQGKGSIDRLMPLLIAGMPEYNHQLLHVNRARAMQMLLEPTFTCDPTLLWTPERAKHIVFSIPTYAVISNGMVIQRRDVERFTPFISNGEVDLQALLASQSIRLGVVAERSYGPVIDQIMKSALPDQLNSHYGNDAIGSLLQMERLGRVQALLSYWPEARFQAVQQGIPVEDLLFFTVKGSPKYQFAHVGCSDTEQGRQAMEVINRQMRILRQTKLIEFYAEWLDPQSREEYLQDAKAFFQSP